MVQIDVELLKTPECVVIRRGSASWQTPTSAVESIPAISLSALGLDPKRIEVATSVVTVRGGSDEDLHFHSSHVVGLAIRGSGVLRTASRQSPRDERRLVLEPGDLVLIPRGALHLFETNDSPEFVYVGLEFSDAPIDYQQHRYYASDPVDAEPGARQAKR